MEENSDKRVVLVVDDDPSIRMLVSNMLKSEGFATETASNGTDALDRATAIHPYIILLDVTV